MTVQKALVTGAVAIAAMVATAGLTVLFYVSPIVTGDDWSTFYVTGQRLLSASPLYARIVTPALFSNAPWLAVVLAPLSLVPLRWGWALVCTITLVLCGALAWKYQFGYLKLGLLMTSPPVVYTLLHGQVDVIVLAMLFLPAAWWPLMALTKPQIGIGLAFPVVELKKTLIVVGLCLLASLAVFGLWPIDLFLQPRPFIGGAHNFWRDLFPYNLVVGLALIVLGMQRRDERYLLAGSPFMLAYATVSNFSGAWLALSRLLSNWQVAVVWAMWWGAVFFRAVS